MSRKQIFSFIKVLVIGVIVASAMGSSGAVQPARAQDPDGDLEEFRSKLAEHYDDLAELYPYIADAAPPGLAERIAESRRNVPELTPEVLAGLREVFSRNPILFDAPKELRSFFEQVEAQAEMSQEQPLAEVRQSCPAVLPDNWCGCPSGLPGGMQDVYIARGVAQSLEFALAFAPSDLVVVTVAAGFGGGGTVSAHPVKLLLQVGYEAAKSAALVVEGVYEVNDACHQGYHRALLVAHDEQVQWKLDNVVELRKVHLQVVELTEKREFLISATEAGKPLADVEFTAVQFSTQDDPGTFIDVTARATVSMVQQGIYLVQLDLEPGGGDPRIYTFQVKHNNDVVEHYGFTMFSRIGPRNLGGGQ